MATMLVVGFTAAPVAAADGTGISFDGDGISIDVGDDVSVDADTEDGVNVEEDVDEGDTDPDVGTPDSDPTQVDSEENDSDGDTFPEEVCTDVTGEVHDSAPYGQVPWFSDLPPEAQPPGVPTSVITPEAVGGIVFGVTPNQCEVQDPNDPTYDPREDDVDPAVDHEVSRFGEYEDGYVGVVRYGVTLNDSNEEGPGVSGVTGVLVTSEFGDANPRIAVQDGEKEYAVDPRVRYWEGGETSYARNDVWLLGSKVGVNVECDGEECQPGTSGLPNYAEYPALPDPVGGDDGGDDGSPFCTDVTGEVHDSAPYGQVPWFDDLPDEAQPPGVPTSVITPEAVGGIVFGVTPNQCEVQDPNDPTYDPREDDVDPAVNYDVARFGEYEGGYVGVVYYEVTLNDSNEHGPGVSGMIGGLATSEFGDANHEIAVQDGEKEYAVDPRVRYWDGGNTSYAANNVRLLGSKLGVNVECDGEECQPGTSGLPHYAEYPALPDPVGGGGGGGDGICTDVTGEVHDSAPYGQVPWFSDLPPEAQPPGVPTSVITPEAVGGIVFGVTPNQCEVQDPNDPTYDPREDDVEPGGGMDVSRFGEYEDGYVGVVRYHVTLNDSNEEGPGVSGVTGVLVTSEFGDVNPRIAVQDGEKEYAVDPRVRYWEDGETSYARNDVWLLGSKVGVNVDCDGEECQPGTSGLPNYAEYPAIPAPTGGD